MRLSSNRTSVQVGKHHYQMVQQPARPEIDIPVDREAAQWIGHELVMRRAPGLGEHNHDVVCNILGKPEDEFASLVIDDVLT